MIPSEGQLEQRSFGEVHGCLLRPPNRQPIVRANDRLFLRLDRLALLSAVKLNQCGLKFIARLQRGRFETLFLRFFVTSPRIYDRENCSDGTYEEYRKE